MRLMLIVLLICSVLAMSLVNGFEVSSEFSINSPVKINSGETKRIGIRIWNDEPSDIKIASSVKAGSDIATVIDSEYLISAGGEREVFLEIKIPDDYQNGVTHTVSIGFRIITSKPDGQLVFGDESVYTLGVKVSNDPVPTWRIGLGVVLVIVVIALLIFLIVFIIKMKKDLRERKWHYSGEGSQYKSV
jgi:uncharacterized membrane protein